MAEDEWRAAQGADAIVFKYSWFAGYSLAEKLGVPCVAAMPFRMTPTEAFPCFWLFGGHDRGRWGNRLLWRLSEQVTWQIGRGEDTRSRRELLHLPPLPLLGPLARQEREGMPVLYAYSPTLLPPPPDWPSRFHVTGTLFLDPPPGWQPPPDLVAFLEAGPPPVYVGFGSMTSADPDATLALVLEALARAGQRGVLSHGWAGLGAGRELPDTVIAVDEVSHSWLFPRMAAVVHHGGAGTTVAGLRAGIPSVVTPLTADQPSWGRIVHRLGAGPRPIPFRHLTATRLSSAIAAAVSDPAIRERAAELGERVREEDGVGRAVQLASNPVGRSDPQWASPTPTMVTSCRVCARYGARFVRDVGRTQRGTAPAALDRSRLAGVPLDMGGVDSPDWSTARLGRRAPRPKLTSALPPSARHVTISSSPNAISFARREPESSTSVDATLVPRSPRWRGATDGPPML